MSELGQKRKCLRFHCLSALPSGADIGKLPAKGRFAPEAAVPDRLISQSVLSLCSTLA